MKTENKATEAARRRYDRNARFYDLSEGLVESRLFKNWRGLLWSKVEGTRILEVGVGTGKNMPYYPANAEITAVDFSANMLKRAKERADKLGIKVRLEQMDVEHLGFDDNTFDAVAGSFVFCSVPDPGLGLSEVMRVCRPDGKVILMEHVLAANRVLGALMNMMNPLMVRVMGANINRRTVENVVRGGLVIEQVDDLGFGIFKLIEARKR